jgi:hypothetical protein
MNEPRRLIHESSNDLERALLESADVDAADPPQHMRSKILAALAIGPAVGAIGATSATAAAAGSVNTAAAWLTVKWIAVGLVAGGVGVAVIHHAVPVRDEPEARAAAPAVSSWSVAARPVPNERAVEAPAAVAETPQPVAEAPIRANIERPAPAAPEPAQNDQQNVALPATLAGEIAELDRARSALKRADAAGARRALQDYERRYSAPSLVPEAEFLWIRTLLAEGQRAAARERALRVLARDGASPYAKRIETMLPEIGDQIRGQPPSSLRRTP